MKINIGENIKKLRAEKQSTQEQLAEYLCISYQAVSKWENNVTTPDIFLLPKIAEYFDVPIDELFKVKADYKNRAERLLAVYEHTHKKEDFEKADAEYEKIFAENKADGIDMRLYGILNEYHSYALAAKAEELYKQAIAAGNQSEGQLIYLLSRTSRNEENIERQQEALKNNPENLRNWRLLAEAYEYAKMYEKALEICQGGLEKFPDDAGLLYQCGDICKYHRKFNDAIYYYEKSSEQDPDMASNYYGMAFVYKELKKYTKAIESWEKVIDYCEKKGLYIQTEWPKREIEKLRGLT